MKTFALIMVWFSLTLAILDFMTKSYLFALLMLAVTWLNWTTYRRHVENEQVENELLKQFKEIQETIRKKKIDELYGNNDKASRTDSEKPQ